MIVYKFARNMSRLCFKLFFKIQIVGLDNLVSDSNFIMCSNHMSNLDPFLVGSVLPVKLRFMAKEELFSNYLSDKLFRAMGAFPIKRGKGDIDAIKKAMRFLRDNENLLMFPEGMRSKGKNLSEGKVGAVSLALKTRTKLIPVAINSTYKIFSKIRLSIGVPIDLSEYYGQNLKREKLQELTNLILMSRIRDLIQ